MIVFQLLVALMVLVLCLQACFYALSLSGGERQKACQGQGILYSTLGVLALVAHNLVFVVTGLILLMLGLRMIAYGLDRQNKTIFIDRYTDDDTPPR